MQSKNNPRVGYKQTPVECRYKKGQSGNPRGRPSGSQSIAAIMDKLLNERIRVAINGRQIVMTGREVLAVQMVNRAVAGDTRIIQLLQRYGGFETPTQPIVIQLLDIEARL